MFVITSFKKKIKSIISFYKSFALAGICITALCLAILDTNGRSTLTALIWFKSLTLTIIFCHINSYKKKEFYYYKNIGFSKRILWTGAIILDLSLFIISIILTLKLK